MLEIRPLREADLPAALRLSTQAGWNQIEADWRRLFELWPDCCFAGVENGNVVATGTMANYGKKVAWVGMILVDQARRGHGHGGAILEHILATADANGVACLGLDATEQGKPVYHKRKFRKTKEINRWVRPAGAMRRADTATTIAGEKLAAIDDAAWPAVLKLDQSAVGIDRAALLRHLARENGANTLTISTRGQVQGAAFSRAGRTASAIGPIVAETPAAAEKLIRSAAANASPDRPIFLDAMTDSPIEPMLASLGFTVQRTLLRMLRPVMEGAAPDGPRVFAGAGFELG